MTEYAQTRSCRWSYLLDYFVDGEEVLDACGHCDRCEPATALAAEVA